jgi:undecaprenyl-diphosphatase
VGGAVTRAVSHVARRDRAELAVLAGVLVLLACLFATFELAAEVVEGDTQTFDERVLQALRDPNDRGTPIGPRWLRIAALDITALGSGVVLGLAVTAITGFLFLQGMTRTALFILASSVGGWILNNGLKGLFARARPSVVPHLSEVASLSFPSGHAMTSAVVYLTLGVLLMRLAERPITKFYCLGVAMVATLLIGSTRVYLGVHYPTDVVAGWLIGFSWALLCWIVERRIERRSGIEAEKTAQQST